MDEVKCDFCEQLATKDAQIAGMSSWAYVCDECFFKHCSCNEETYTTLKNIGKPKRIPYSD